MYITAKIYYDDMDDAMAKMLKNATRHSIRQRGQKSVADARNDLSDVINGAYFASDITVITRRNKPAAAVVPMWVLELVDQVLSVAKNDS